MRAPRSDLTISRWCSTWWMPVGTSHPPMRRATRYRTGSSGMAISPAATPTLRGSKFSMLFLLLPVGLGVEGRASVGRGQVVDDGGFVAVRLDILLNGGFRRHIQERDVVVEHDAGRQ